MVQRTTTPLQILSFSRPALLVLLTAFLVRGAMLLVVLENPERAIRRDSVLYLDTAVNLLEGNGFSQMDEPPFRESALLTPTYPLLLAGAISLFSDKPGAVAAIQVLIDMASVVLVYLVGRRLFSERAAVVGSLLYALSLATIVHSVFILTETLFTFLVLGAVSTVILYRSTERKLWLAAAGVLSGLAILCRPIAILFPLIIVIAVGLIHRDRWKAALVPAILYLLLTILTVTPWLARNNRLLGVPLLTTVSNHNMYLYNAVALEADQRGISQNLARNEMLNKANAELATSGWTEDEVRRDELYAGWAREIIASNPGRYLFIHLRSDLNSLLPAVADFLELLGVTEGSKGTLSVLNQHGLAAAVNHYFEDMLWLLVPLLPLMVILGLTYLGSAIGVIVLLRERRWTTLALVLLPILYFLLIPGPPANPRFRVPVMPYISLLAGLGLVVAFGWLSRQWATRIGAGAQGA